MSVLLIETGNTAWKIARSLGGDAMEFIARGFGEPGLMETLESLTADEIISATVAPDSTLSPVRQYADKKNIEFTQVKTTDGFGVGHCYADYSRLGVDRWLTLVALAPDKSNVLVIDAGTAITADALSGDGQHLGGWIAPGFRLMQEALISKSSRLTVNEEIPDAGFSANTENAIYAGANASLNGFVIQAQKNAETIFKNDYYIVITGGDAGLLDKKALTPTLEERPHLVLEGLNQYLELR